MKRTDFPPQCQNCCWLKVNGKPEHLTENCDIAAELRNRRVLVPDCAQWFVPIHKDRLRKITVAF